MAVPGLVREHYLSEIGRLVERYRRELGAAGIDYQLLKTTDPLELALCRTSRRAGGSRDRALFDAARRSTDGRSGLICLRSCLRSF